MTELTDLALTPGSDRVVPLPGLIGVGTEPLHTHESHAPSKTKLTRATHIDTHVGAPYHFPADGTTEGNMPLDRYIGPALLLDFRKVDKGLTPLSVADIQQAGGTFEAVKDKIVVLFNGWAEEESGGVRFYSQEPYLSNEGAAYLADNGVNAVYVDFPIDNHPPTAQSTINDFPVHRLLQNRGIPLNKSLINLDQVVDREFELWALPIKLKDGDGAAARAVARIF